MSDESVATNRKANLALGCTMLLCLASACFGLAALAFSADHCDESCPCRIAPPPSQTQRVGRTYRLMRKIIAERGSPIEIVDMGDGRIRWVYGVDEYVDYLEPREEE